MYWRRAVAVLVLLGGVVVPAMPAAPEVAPATVAVCPPAEPGTFQCLSEVLVDPRAAEVDPDKPIQGIKPKQLRRAYNFPAGDTVGKGKTIAIVVAFHAPTLENDLNAYSRRFDLPQCTVASGCLTIVNQTGGSTPPAVDTGWALEASIDVQMVHAVAPGAKIVVVEATNNSFTNLLAALDHARTRAPYISNSWGATETNFVTLFDHHFTDVPGISFFFSSGDIGGERLYPATSPFVVAVGGTKLWFDGGEFKRETGWSNGGGNCSDFEPASGPQAAHAGYAAVNCAGKRATPDIAAVADPPSGVAIYDSTPHDGHVGWFVMGGTSVSAPIIAARAAITGALVDQAYIYGNNIAYRDIKVGNNSNPCLPGYDLVTGRGSWTR